MLWAFGGGEVSPPSLPPGTPLGDVPQTPCALPTAESWLRHWFRGKNVLKTVEMAIWHKKVDYMNRVRKSFLSLDLCSLTCKNIFMTLSHGGSPPCVRHWLGFQLEPCWQHLAVKSTSRLRLYVVHYGKRAFTHVRPAHQCTKAKCNVVLFRVLLYEDASFPAWNCQLAHRTVSFALTVTAPQAPALQ